MSLLSRPVALLVALFALAGLLVAIQAPVAASDTADPSAAVSPAAAPPVAAAADPSTALLADQPALIFAESHDPGAAFRIWGRDAAVRIGPEGLEIERILRESSPTGRLGLGRGGLGDGLLLQRMGPEPGAWGLAEPPAVQQEQRLRLRLVGASPARIEGIDPRRTRLNFFHGQPEAWRTGLPSFGAVRMVEPWPGVSLIWIAEDGGGLRAQVELAPGADLDRVAFAIEGAETQLDANGILRDIGGSGPLLRLGGADAAVAYEAPRTAVAEAGVDGRSPAGTPEDGGARDATSAQVRLDLPEPARTQEAQSVQDVAFVYAGVWGLPGLDRGLGIAVDDEGGAYLTGEAWIEGDREAYVLKVAPSGSEVEYLSFVGGDGQDASFDIVVDEAGNSYFCGATSSTASSFPVVGGPQREFNGMADVLVASLDATGESLRYAGYLGGSTGDFCEGVQVDAQGQLYLTGVASSGDFPAKVGPDLSHNGQADAFITMLPAEVTSEDWQDNVVYSGFIGGSGHDVYVYTPDDRPNEFWATAGHVTIDAEGAAYISGGTNSDEASFPTGEGFGELPGPDQSFGGLWDAWVAKVLPGGAGLAYATYFGGAGEDLAFGMEVDAAGAAYFTGGADSPADSLGPVAGPGMDFSGGFLDVIAAKIAPDGSRFEYAGYLGGAGTEMAVGMSLDAEGRAILIGYVDEGEGFPIKGGPDDSYNSPAGGIGDAFVCRLKADPSSSETIDNVDFCGYIGGTAFDQAFWADVGPDGAIYIAGDTESGADSFPNGQGMDGHAAPVSDFGGSSDAFVVKLDVIGLTPPGGEPTPGPTATPADPVPTATPEPGPGEVEGMTVYLPRVVRE